MVEEVVEALKHALEEVMALMQRVVEEGGFASLQQHDQVVGEHFVANIVVCHHKGHLWAQEEEAHSTRPRHHVSFSSSYYSI